MLLADGYIVTETGRGTYVAAVRTKEKNISSTESLEIPLSIVGKRAVEYRRKQQYTIENRPSFDGKENHEWTRVAASSEQKVDSIRFDKGEMPVTDFPYAEWKRVIASKIRSDASSIYDPAGDYSLRSAIAGHLRQSRGIAVDPEQIVLFSGSMQGIALLTQTLLNNFERAVIENPGFPGFLQAVHISGGVPVYASVDEEGIIPEDWDASLLYVTPSRHFPTGAVLPLARRQQLLSWAHKRNAVIIEDSYDSDFRFGGRPIEPLKVLDLEDRVIYIGSFSKTMYPGFRLGYAVLPRQLIQAVLAVKTFYDPYPPGITEQRGLAEWMARGGYAKHVRRLTRLYRNKLNVFIEAMGDYIDDLFHLHVGDAGIRVYATWKRSNEEYIQFVAKCREHGVYMTDSSIYQMTGNQRPAVYFGYVHLSEERIKEGVRRMAASWEEITIGSDSL